MAGLFADTVRLHRGNGLGDFTFVESFGVANGPSHVLSADLDLDGVDDVIVAAVLSDALTVLPGGGGFDLDAIAVVH